MTMATLRTLPADSRGVTVVEFALVAPILLMMLLGIFDLGHTMYTRSLLLGAIQKTARDSSIEGASGNQSTLDGKITTVVQAIAPGAALTFKRRAYQNFSDVARGEDYTDTDLNGICDKGEPYEDANNNNTWDSLAGADGFGGARDAVHYTVTVNFERIFPAYAFIGGSKMAALTAETVLRNQPYATQSTSTPTLRNCA